MEYADKITDETLFQSGNLKAAPAIESIIYFKLTGQVFFIIRITRAVIYGDSFEPCFHEVAGDIICHIRRMNYLCESLENGGFDIPAAFTSQFRHGRQ